jgi:hypothetical protein
MNSSEKIKLGIIGGMILITVALYGIKSSKKSRDIQESSSTNSVVRFIKDTIASNKKSYSGPTYSTPSIILTSDSKGGGSRRKHFKKVGKRKTTRRK